MDDQVLYQEIGQLLADSCPRNAVKIVVRVELFTEGDGGKYEFDYFDEQGVLGWFNPDGRAVRRLTELLVGLRQFFSENNLFLEGVPWVGCTISLNLTEGRLGVEFDYA